MAVGTVGRTYRELEQDGLLTSRRGGGTRVATVGRTPSKDRRQLLGDMASDFVTRAQGLGFSDEEIVVALGRRLPLGRAIPDRTPGRSTRIRTGSSPAALAS